MNFNKTFTTTPVLTWTPSNGSFLAVVLVKYGGGVVWWGIMLASIESITDPICETYTMVIILKLLGDTDHISWKCFMIECLGTLQVRS